MSTTHIKKVNVMSLGKIVAIIYAVLFEILVIILVTPPTLSGIGNAELLSLAGVILLAPVIYGALGFVTGAFIALVFNIISGFINRISNRIARNS